MTSVVPRQRKNNVPSWPSIVTHQQAVPKFVAAQQPLASCMLALPAPGCGEDVATAAQSMDLTLSMNDTWQRNLGSALHPQGGASLLRYSSAIANFSVSIVRSCCHTKPEIARRRLEPAGHAFHAVHEKPKIKAPGFELGCSCSMNSLKGQKRHESSRQQATECKQTLRACLSYPYHQEAASDDDSPPTDAWRRCMGLCRKLLCFLFCSTAPASLLRAMRRKKKKEATGRTGALRLSPLLVGRVLSPVKIAGLLGN